jgi:hypothetical protein
VEGTQDLVASYVQYWNVNGTACASNPLGFAVSVSASFLHSSVSLTNDSHPLVSPNTFVGDGYTLTFTGAPGGTVSLTEYKDGALTVNNQPQPSVIPSNGVLQVKAVRGSSEVGVYIQYWTINGTPLTPSPIQFLIGPSPTTPFTSQVNLTHPLFYPNYYVGDLNRFTFAGPPGQIYVTQTRNGELEYENHLTPFLIQANGLFQTELTYQSTDVASYVQTWSVNGVAASNSPHSFSILNVTPPAAKTTKEYIYVNGKVVAIETTNQGRRRRNPQP